MDPIKEEVNDVFQKLPSVVVIQAKTKTLESLSFILFAAYFGQILF